MWGSLTSSDDSGPVTPFAEPQRKARFEWSSRDRQGGAEWPLCEAAAPHVGHPGSPVHAAHHQCHHHGAQQSSEQEARTGKAGCDEHARDEEHW